VDHEGLYEAERASVKAGNEVSANAAAASTPTPTITDVKPTTHSIATDGATLHLEITGTNLDGVTGVKLVKTGASSIIGTKVTASATKIAYDFNVTSESSGVWSIEVSEGEKPAKAAGEVTITA